MENELNPIKDKIINKLLFVTILFAIVPFLTSLTRVIDVGWSNVFALHILLYISFAFLYYFRTKISLHVKIHFFSIIYIFAGIAGLYSFGIAGGFYFCFVPIVVNGILRGLKAAFIYSFIIILLYSFIGLGFVTQLIHPVVDLGEYSTLVIAWVNLLVGVVFIIVIILVSVTDFYQFFILSISEKQNSVQQFLKGEKQMKHVFNNSPAIMLLLNEYTEIIDINKAGLMFAKADFESILKKRQGQVFRCIHSARGDRMCQDSPDCKDCLLRIIIERTMLTGEAYQKVEINLPIVEEDGSETIYTFLLSTSVVAGDSEKLILVILDNITEQKKVEQSLIESEKRYREIFNATGEAIFIHDEETGLVLDTNETAIKMLDCESKDEIISKNSGIFSAKELGFDEKKAYERIQEAREHGSTTFEWLGQKVNGETFWVEVSLKKTVIRGENRILAVVRNIDRRKKMEAALNERNETFRTVFSKSADGVLLIEDGIFVDCNESVMQMLELESRDQIIGKHPWDISPEKQPDGKSSKTKAMEMMDNTLKNGYHRFEWLHSTLTGQGVYFDIVLTLIFINNKQIIHCVWRDITEKKRIDAELEKHRNHLEKLVQARTIDLQKMNEELSTTNKKIEEKSRIISEQNDQLKSALHDLKEAQIQLIQSEKMASLGVLTAGVAHEINNPLNFIMGAYNGLNVFFQEIKTDDERVSILMKSIKTGVERVTAIVRGLNQFSRERETYDEMCNIESIVENCLIMLQNKIKNKITVVTEYACKPCLVKGNTGKLHQVFLNILHNSIQAIPDKGKIEITGFMENKNVIIKIKDDGEGISEENLARVTDPFFTTKQAGVGTGLGLSITYRIIQEHKGKLFIESSRGSGTTVSLTLPID